MGAKGPRAWPYGWSLYWLRVPEPNAISLILSLGGYYHMAYEKVRAKAKEQVCTVQVTNIRNIVIINKHLD